MIVGANLDYRAFERQVTRPSHREVHLASVCSRSMVRKSSCRRLNDDGNRILVIQLIDHLADLATDHLEHVLYIDVVVYHK